MLDEDHTLVTHCKRAAALVGDPEHSVERDLLPHFKNTHLTGIDYQKIVAFVKRLEERNVSSNTLKNNLMVPRKYSCAMHGYPWAYSIGVGDAPAPSEALDEISNLLSSVFCP